MVVLDVSGRDRVEQTARLQELSGLQSSVDEVLELVEVPLWIECGLGGGECELRYRAVSGIRLGVVEQLLSAFEGPDKNNGLSTESAA